MTGEKPVTVDAATLDWGVRLLYLQCAGLVALTAYLIVLDLTSGDIVVAIAVSLTVMSALAALAVFAVARALGRRSARARGPAIVVQLFLLATGGFLLQIGPRWAGAGLLVLAALTALLILLPPSSRALGVD
ncbi:hypothetical protein GCM10010112_05420 [Actinoplanes lobatus]|uniref:Integral membrane protein n=1 Tax=Actinoplanes lobatus TaxID=113568 RepID=A0A7W7HAM7_9ACTN|nr:hypothetical protein [Actinoplanes lobatus]MBB4746963.1 hypothetical protein [Actinoplanes lobatus]GGN55053.1 hypothetical protein GCM10010112_05420 [Actinoplanes lobatus]GIE41784.1 hypothetical protein Alo02nite_46820 [Actinoplanes lobatus]